MLIRTVFSACCLILISVFTSPCHADLILGNTFDGNTPGGVVQFTAGQVTDANITSTGVGRPGYTLNGGFDALVAAELRGFVQPVNNGTRFFSFDVTPINGASVDFDEFVYAGFTTLDPNSASTVGPDFFEFRFSVDGANFTPVPGAAEAGATIDLSGLAGLQDVTSTVNFQLFVQADDDASPNTSYSLDSFEFNGTVTAVPEPSSLLGLGALAGFILVGRRRRVA